MMEGRAALMIIVILIIGIVVGGALSSASRPPAAPPVTTTTTISTPPTTSTTTEQASTITELTPGPTTTFESTRTETATATATTTSVICCMTSTASTTKTYNTTQTQTTTTTSTSIITSTSTATTTTTTSSITTGGNNQLAVTLTPPTGSYSDVSGTQVPFSFGVYNSGQSETAILSVSGPFTLNNYGGNQVQLNPNENSFYDQLIVDSSVSAGTYQAALIVGPPNGQFWSSVTVSFSVTLTGSTGGTVTNIVQSNQAAGTGTSLTVALPNSVTDFHTLVALAYAASSSGVSITDTLNSNTQWTKDGTMTLGANAIQIFSITSTTGPDTITISSGSRAALILSVFEIPTSNPSGFGYGSGGTSTISLANPLAFSPGATGSYVVLGMAVSSSAVSPASGFIQEYTGQNEGTEASSTCGSGVTALAITSNSGWLVAAAAFTW